ncbi:MAG: hypothetical protein EA421_11430 [Gemmatimonadales bacterium]|nr:MAG: hypothetical protein EA421_11430 [Gemmatimonadales bacterium]
MKGLSLLPLLLLLAATGACTLDLTDPPLVGDEPARLVIGITVSELEGEGACWSVRISAWPLLQDGRFVPARDSTAHIAGTAHLPARRPHELSPFIYRATRECGSLPEVVALSIPWLDGIGELDWPLEAMPFPRGVAPPEVEVPAGGVAWIDVPIVSPPFPFSGEVISFWNARVSRAPDAPEEQEDHQLLTNSSTSSSTTFALGAPFTSVAGTLWDVRWGTLTRIDEATLSGRLEAALEFSVTRVTRLRVVEDAP